MDCLDAIEACIGWLWKHFNHSPPKTSKRSAHRSTKELAADIRAWVDT
jgi:hypothetical protein